MWHFPEGTNRNVAEAREGGEGQARSSEEQAEGGRCSAEGQGKQSEGSGALKAWRTTATFLN